MPEFERMILLRSIDTHWTDHIDTMDRYAKVYTYVHMHNKIHFVITKMKDTSYLT